MTLNRLNVDRIAWKRLNLLAQIFDVRADQFWAAGVAWIIPHVLQQLLAVENLVRVAHQVIEQVKLDIG